jgi:hypothetical protein
MQSAWPNRGSMASRQQPQVHSTNDRSSALPARGGVHAPSHSSGTYDRLGGLGSANGLFAAANWNRSESVELRVQTAEGDVATLSFAQSSSSAVAMGAVRSGLGSIEALAWSAEDSSEVSFQVAGDLNESELAAIEALADRVNLVTEEFFEGDMDAAIETAGQLDLDNAEAEILNAFSFEMRSTETLEAAAVLQQGEKPSTPPPAPIEPKPIGSSERPTNPFASASPEWLQNLLKLLEGLTETRADSDPTMVPTVMPADADLAASTESAIGDRLHITA